MYICICNGVTEQAVRQCVIRGARCLSDLESSLGLGSGCGKCREFATAVLDESHQQNANGGATTQITGHRCAQ